MLTIAIGLCAAWLGDEPSLNRPRAQSFQALPSVVVPAGHEESQRDSVLIPPAPLPEFHVEGDSPIRFEFSNPPSCADEQSCPLIPPTKLGRRHDEGSISRSRCLSCPASGPVVRTSTGTSPETSDAATPAKDAPQTISELRHLRQALDHLEAAGMKELTQTLQKQYRASVEKLRPRVEQELEARQAELKRLQDEIAELKHVLIGDATLEFRVEYYVLDLVQLRKLAQESSGDIQQAAQFVLKHEPSPRPEFRGAYYDALRLLADRDLVQCRSRPTISTMNGQEASVCVGSAAPLAQTQDSREHDSGTLFTVRAEIQTDGTIAARMAYWHKEPGETGYEHHLETNRVLISGETVVLSGGKRHTGVRTTSGVFRHCEEMDVLLVTPKIVPSDERTLSAGRSEDDIQWIDAADASQFEEIIETTAQVEDVPQPPVRRLINPQFYVGGAPKHIEEAWNEAFRENGAGIILHQSYEQPNLPKSRILQFDPENVFPQFVDGVIRMAVPSIRWPALPTTSDGPQGLKIHGPEKFTSPKLMDADDVLPAAPVPQEDGESDDDPVT